MAVQAGEGTTDIIYGTTSVPAGPRTFGGYLARPNGQGEWPTVLVYGPDPVPSSSIKNICRVIARHGIAALAPDLVGAKDADLLVSTSMSAFVRNQEGDWSNAEYGFGVLAFEGGVVPASDLAAADGRVLAFASVGSALDGSVVESLAAAAISGLYVGSRADEPSDAEGSTAASDRLPQTTFAVYPDAETGFWNDDADGFEERHYDDAIDRVIGFFGETLPPRV
ncbi:MAG: dienelactone hydrolase family protein [Acidimicrobiia bacterium]